MLVLWACGAKNGCSIIVAIMRYRYAIILIVVHVAYSSADIWTRTDSLLGLDIASPTPPLLEAFVSVTPSALLLCFDKTR